MASRGVLIHANVGAIRVAGILNKKRRGEGAARHMPSITARGPVEAARLAARRRHHRVIILGNRQSAKAIRPAGNIIVSCNNS